jgi:hypothetical protein
MLGQPSNIRPEKPRASISRSVTPTGFLEVAKQSNWASRQGPRLLPETLWKKKPGLHEARLMNLTRQPNTRPRSGVPRYAFRYRASGATPMSKSTSGGVFLATLRQLQTVHAVRRPAARAIQAEP